MCSIARVKALVDEAEMRSNMPVGPDALMTRVRFALIALAATSARGVLATSAIKAAPVEELWVGSLVVGAVAGLAAYLLARHRLMAGSLVLIAATLCWVEPVPAPLVSEVERMFGANYNLHALLTSLLAPLLTLAGVLLGWSRVGKHAN